MAYQNEGRAAVTRRRPSGCLSRQNDSSENNTAPRIVQRLSRRFTAIKNAETCVRTAQIIYQAAGDRRSHGDVDKQRLATMNGLNGLANSTWTTRDFSRGTAPNWLQAVARLRTDPDARFPELQTVADLLPGEPGPGTQVR